MTNADKIRDFHAAINGVAMPTRPTVPALDLLLLRQKLVDEEYEEVTAAFHELAERVQGGATETADLAPLVHELTDLLYVTYGAILSCGVDPDAVFAEIHAANMRKTAGPRRADGKQLKPEGWQPADVRGVLASLQLGSS